MKSDFGHTHCEIEWCGADRGHNSPHSVSVNAAPTAPAERPEQTALLEENYIGWARYIRRDEWPTRLELCDSDDEGAFKISRFPQLFTACNNCEALKQSHAALLKALGHLIREWCEIIGDETVNSTPADTLEKARAALANAKALEGLPDAAFPPAKEK